MMPTNLYGLAMRFVGVREVAGSASNPQVLAMLKLSGSGDFDAWPEDDAVPWCSAFVNYIAWLARYPRSKSLRARSWLRVGVPIELGEAEPGFDVVILKRGRGEQPGPDVIKAPGHVGFFAGIDGPNVLVLGGNQSNAVTVAPYPRGSLLGVRRLQR